MMYPATTGEHRQNTARLPVRNPCASGSTRNAPLIQLGLQAPHPHLWRQVAMRPAVHFVGFRDDRFNAACRVWGKPDFIHRKWDHRAQREIAPGDTVIFADGSADQSPSHPNASDIDERQLGLRKSHPHHGGLQMTDSEWQPIETAKKDKTRRYLYGRVYWNDPDQQFVTKQVIGYWNGREWVTDTENPNQDGILPTHWMPLFAPPEDELP